MYNTSIKIGPVKKAPKAQKSTNSSVISETIRQRLTTLKVGNFFEITGISSPKEVTNLRGIVCYHSKRKGIKVSTSYDNGILIVERVKEPKTKEVPTV